MRLITSKRRAAIAAGSLDTAAAGAEILRAGGNAFDAVVAAGFAATVAESALTSLGGGSFLQAAPMGADPVVLDFFVDAPGRGRPLADLEPHFLPVTVHFAATSDVYNCGWGSVGVPGTLDGLLETHRRWGTLPLADVVAPAVALARAGAVINETQAYVLSMLSDILELSPEGRAIFAPQGTTLKAGERLHNGALADTLAEVAAGRLTGIADFGSVLEDAMTAGGGLVTRADTDAYAVIDRAPLDLTSRGVRILTNPPPSYGGTLIAEALRTIGQEAPLDGSPESYVRLVEALVAMSERKHPTPQAVRGTTHMSVVDSDGNVASMTASNGSSGGVFIPGTGIQLNNVMGEADLHPDGFHVTPPGQRIGSMMSPSVVRFANGESVGLGSAGSQRIRSAITRLLTLLVEEGVSVEEAVNAPRLHWDGEALQVEPGLPREVLAALRTRWTVAEWNVRELYFGGAHAVSRTAEGAVSAVGDPRRSGAGLVVQQP